MRHRGRAVSALASFTTRVTTLFRHVRWTLSISFDHQRLNINLDVVPVCIYDLDDSHLPILVGTYHQAQLRTVEMNQDHYGELECECHKPDIMSSLDPNTVDGEVKRV